MNFTYSISLLQCLSFKYNMHDMWSVVFSLFQILTYMVLISKVHTYMVFVFKILTYIVFVFKVLINTCMVFAFKILTYMVFVFEVFKVLTQCLHGICVQSPHNCLECHTTQMQSTYIDTIFATKLKTLINFVNCQVI